MERKPLAFPTLFSAALALNLAGASLVAAAPASKAVSLRTADGVRIAGTYYPPKGPGSAPSVILLHMLNRSKRDWDAFARALAEAGYAVLAIDLRGHGESVPGGTSWRDFSPAAFRAMVQDVAAAHEYLKEATGADGGRLALIGASIGANVALNYGAQNSSVKGLILLSPGLDYRGVTTKRAMRTYGGRPVLIVASREDGYSARSSSTLDSLSRGRHRLILYDSAGHGTRMFGKVPHLKATILDWLASTP